MKLNELLEMTMLHSDFVKKEDKDKLLNLLKLAYSLGQYDNFIASKPPNPRSRWDTPSIRSRFQERIHDWLAR